MALYRVEFSNDWIMGRWGFTDAALSRLKARVTEPSRLENAWLVDYPGTPAALGDLLSERLNIQAADYERCGTIFEITILSGSPAAMPKRPRSRSPAATPPWERRS